MLAIAPYHSVPLLDGALHPDEFVEDSDSKDVRTALSATAESMGNGQGVLEENLQDASRARMGGSAQLFRYNDTRQP